MPPDGTSLTNLSRNFFDPRIQYILSGYLKAKTGLAQIRWLLVGKVPSNSALGAPKRISGEVISQLIGSAADFGFDKYEEAVQRIIQGGHSIKFQNICENDLSLPKNGLKRRDRGCVKFLPRCSKHSQPCQAASQQNNSPNEAGTS